MDPFSWRWDGSFRTCLYSLIFFRLLKHTFGWKFYGAPWSWIYRVLLLWSPLSGPCDKGRGWGLIKIAIFQEWSFPVWWALNALAPDFSNFFVLSPSLCVPLLRFFMKDNMVLKEACTVLMISTRDTGPPWKGGGVPQIDSWYYSLFPLGKPCGFCCGVALQGGAIMRKIQVLKSFGRIWKSISADYLHGVLHSHPSWGCYTAGMMAWMIKVRAWWSWPQAKIWKHEEGRVCRCLESSPWFYFQPLYFDSVIPLHSI